MRNLFTDGKNSVWHVLFGMIGYYCSYVAIIFVLYQMVTEIPLLHNNMFIDISEFLVKELNFNQLLGIEAELVNIDPKEKGVMEGKRKLSLHYKIERNSNIIKMKKLEEKKNKGSLACEICNFNFEKKYGAKGRDYIECHHNTPLSRIKYGSVTKLSDLSLLCANCHRMIHRKHGCTKEELSKIYNKYK